MGINDEVLKVRATFGERMKNAQSPEDVNGIRVEYLGKKGVLTGLLRGLGSAAPEERPAMGAAVNALRDELETTIEARSVTLRAEHEHALEMSGWIDVTLPGCGGGWGKAHPVMQTMKEITDIFVSLGFGVETGPEVETDYYNFEAMNFQPHHPARDMQDTFFVEGQRLLRTHTSPVQVRSMLKHGAPIRIVCPGRVYRRDSDPTHSPMFHQIEGLLLDKNVSVADLKGCLQAFVDAIFGRPLKSRFRASYFPFTEPSLEMDVECVICGRTSGCRVCKGTGWLEILGSGMVHPNVIRSGGIDPDVYNGFAWGLGVDRVAMLKYGLCDLRPMFEGDLGYIKGGSL